MMENVNKKEDQLIRQCPHDKELMLKKQQQTSSLEHHLNKVLGNMPSCYCIHNQCIAFPSFNYVNIKLDSITDSTLVC